MSANGSIGKVVETLIGTEARKATKYISPTVVINATRVVYGGRIDRRDKSISIVLKIGRPNYAEQQFIKLCKKANVPFPVRNIQLKFFKEKK